MTKYSETVNSTSSFSYREKTLSSFLMGVFFFLKRHPLSPSFSLIAKTTKHSCLSNIRLEEKKTAKKFLNEKRYGVSPIWNAGTCSWRNDPFAEKTTPQLKKMKEKKFETWKKNNMYWQFIFKRVLKKAACFWNLVFLKGLSCGKRLELSDEVPKKKDL